MDFRLTAEQELLVQTAREFFQEHCPPLVVQELADDARGFPEMLWRRIAALGWPGLLIPPAFGGSGGSILDVILLVEEMGHACFPSPYIHSCVVVPWLLRHAGSAAQQAQWLPAIASGERLCTLAVVEEEASFAMATLAMHGEVGGGLNGRKLFVKDAHIADGLLVVVRGSGGCNLLLLDSTRAGISYHPLDAMTGERLFEVRFVDVPVREADLLGPPGKGEEALRPAWQLGALARSAEMLGCAQRILEFCVEYAKVREQFGRPIGSFQAIQHACADLLRNVEGTRALVYQAAWKMQEGQACQTEVAMAKAYAEEQCLWVARKGHQILGAIGYCEEHPLHLFHKRIQAAALDFGDAAWHSEVVAAALGLV